MINMHTNRNVFLNIFFIDYKKIYFPFENNKYRFKVS